MTMEENNGSGLPEYAPAQAEPRQAYPPQNQPPAYGNPTPSPKTRRKGNVVQWVALGLSVVALLTSGFAATQAISLKSTRTVTASVPKTHVSGLGSLDSDDDYENKTQSSKKTDDAAKTVEYAAKESSQLEGDYAMNNTHVKIVGLQATGKRATITCEITNNSDTVQGDEAFTLTAMQDGRQVGGDIIIAPSDRTIQPGFTTTTTTEFDIDDPSQPLNLTVDLYDSQIQAEFDPQQ